MVIHLSMVTVNLFYLVVSFSCSIQAHGQVIVKQVIPDSPVHVPAVHAYPSPQIHIQPSAPGELPI